MGETDSGLWGLFWWAGPYSVNFQSNFLLMGGAVFPPCCLAWGETMIGVMKVKKTSFRRTYAHTVVFSAPDPAAGLCWPMLLLETPGYSQASLAQSLVRTLLFFPGSWWAQAFVCGLQSQISWGFSVPLPDPQVGKFVVNPRTFLTVQELLWYNFSVVCGSSAQGLYGGANGNLLQEGLCHRPHVPGLLQPEAVFLWQATADPCLCRRHSKRAKAGLAQSLCSLWVLMDTRFCLSVFWASLAGMEFDYECNFVLATILLGLLLYSWIWHIFFWWDSTFSCWWVFSSKWQFWSSCRKTLVHILLLCHHVPIFHNV